MGRQPAGGMLSIPDAPGSHFDPLAGAPSASDRPKLMRRLFARAVLRTIGWTIEGVRPDVDRCVVVAAPHTSNWDFPMLIAYAWAFELPIGFVGKHTLFEGPLGWLMRSFGGVPVRRDRREGLVKQLAEALREDVPRALVIPAEGSRSWGPRWKSGFYHVAREADVPVVLSYLDYAQKAGGFGPGFRLSGDVIADMDVVRDFYADKKGKFPENSGPILLIEEQPGSEVVDARPS
jgi:1-acyl-sn-glycerol-3-phosphate acyltransferase